MSSSRDASGEYRRPRAQSIRRFATRPRSGCRTRSRSTKATRCLPSPRIVVDAHVAGIGSVVRDLRGGAGARHGPAAPDDTTIFWEQGLLDVLFEYPIQSDRSRFSIHARVRSPRAVGDHGAAVPAARRRRSRLRVRGDAGLVRLDPRWHQAALRFVGLGFFHILDGIDHLLFLLCLVIPFRRFRALIPIVTSFTVAHSITLIASAYKLAPDALWFPPLIETLIAMSIVYMALENIVAAATGCAAWMITFAFGLVHGFGFSFGLEHTLQFAGSHLLTSLLSFNVGVELGQLLVLALLVPALGAAVPVRRRRADGHDHPVGARRPHRLALDDRTLRRAAAVSVAGGHRRRPRGRHALADAARRCRGDRVAASSS